MSEGPKRVLLLVPTHTYRAHDFLEAARRMGVEVVVGSNRKQALADAAPGMTLAVDFQDLEGAVEAIRRFHDSRPLAAVIGADDQTTRLGAEAARALGLPHNPPEAVAATRDKHAMRNALADAGLPSPAFRLVHRGEDIARLATRIDYPCVLKPTFLSASRGVLRADDAAGFVVVFERIGALLDRPEVRAEGGAAADHVLVEDYIPGDELAVEAMLAGGTLHLLALFDKPDPLEGPVFEETLYVTPSRAPEPAQENIVATVRAAVRALGLREGPVHAELRVNASGAWVIDLAARAIGGLCPRVLRFGTGRSLEELILAHALGRDFTRLRREPLAAGVMMIPIPGRGILEEVRGLDAARRIDGVDEVTISIPRGHELVPLPEGDRYLGFIFARRGTPAEVEAALRRAHACLEIRIRPPATAVNAG